MFTPVYTKQFSRDVKKAQKKNEIVSSVLLVTHTLIQQTVTLRLEATVVGQNLPHPHSLFGVQISTRGGPGWSGYLRERGRGGGFFLPSVLAAFPGGKVMLSLHSCMFLHH